METIARRLAVTILSLFLVITQIGCQASKSESAGATPAKGSGSIDAGQLPREGLFDGAQINSANIDVIVSNVHAGGVLIVSEQHENQKHYARQMLALEALAKTKRCTVSVGLEFLAWPRQDIISDYFHGKVDEAQFLKATEWGGSPFSGYRDQALFSRSTGGELIGLNAPRSLTSAISKNGLASLTVEQAALLPPDFELGSKDYRERFDVIMGTHVPVTALERYFAALSVWDESMAWSAKEFLHRNPTHCLVVIVGDFHASWRGGLPARLAARGIANITVVSQIETNDLTEEQLAAELGPHSRFGPRADAIWLSSSVPVQP